MPIATRTFRVFVSSTFEDLKRERDALQREVFPKLRRLCEQYGARFQAIDLRWGVRDEASLDQQTLEICLREIRRCQATGVKPNFIVLLGNRYGWQPLPARIAAAEFNALQPHIPDKVRTLAAQWYMLDENAVPPEYCLQPRTREFVTPAAWNPVEQALHQAIARAARAAGMPQAELIKYEASATHQEVLAGLGEAEGDQKHVFGFFRRTTEATDARLEDLKIELRARLPGNIIEFDPGDMAGLCDNAFAHLRKVIESEMKRFQDRPALDLEVEAHDLFAKECSLVFTGRQAVLNTIAEYLCGLECRPLVLHGESGSGKSAVMAKASQQYKGPGRVIRRFIGVSPQSTSGHALLTSLCQQIVPGETPVDYGELEQAFMKRLSTAMTEQPLILFIDALDQLSASDPARNVNWLPPELPPHVKVIISTTGGTEHLATGLTVQVGHMSPSEARDALEDFLYEAHRTLQPGQRDTVLAHFERCGLPLYLKLAAEESRLWKSYVPEDKCKLGEGIAAVIATLFDRMARPENHGPILVERSLAYLAAARFGLTEDEILDILTADDALWSDFDRRKRQEVSERRLPVVVWSRLSLDLEPYLAEHAAPGGTVITFFHRQLREYSAEQFLPEAESLARHAAMASYFSVKPEWLDESRRVPDARRCVELPFQERGSQQWAKAEQTLLDSHFLNSKVANGMILDLEDDYQSLLEEAPQGALARTEMLRLIRGALRLSEHTVVQHPSQFTSQMVGRLLPRSETSGMGDFILTITKAAPRPWLRPLIPALHPPGTVLVRTIVTHWEGTSIAVTADGKRALWASEGHGDRKGDLVLWDLETGQALRTLQGHRKKINAVAVTPDWKRAVSASNDSTLRVWDLETGGALRTLQYHTSLVKGVALTPDGKQAVSEHYAGERTDETLIVWDLDTGGAVRALKGPSIWDAGVALTADGKRAISASWVYLLNVWDLETGKLVRTLKGGHTMPVKAVAMTEDGKHVISGSSDHTLKVWDLETGTALRTLNGHLGGVEAVTTSADGKRAISASNDRTLKVWDLEMGAALWTLRGHSGTVTAVAVTRDGKRVVSTSADRTIKVWDLEREVAPWTVQAHSSRVVGVAVSADGKRAVSASSSGTLRLWDVQTGMILRTLEGDGMGVGNGLSLTADGKRAICAGTTLNVWDLEAGTVLRSLESQGFAFVATSADGARAVCTHTKTEGTRVDIAPGVKIWDLEKGRAIRTVKGNGIWKVTDVAVTADGKRAIVAPYSSSPGSSGSSPLVLLDLSTGRVLRTLKGHTVSASRVALTSDGRRAVSSSSDKTMILWDIETGAALRTLDLSPHWCTLDAVSSDGKLALTGQLDGTVRVWGLETGKMLATFTCDASAVCGAFAGHHMVIVGDEGGRIHFLSIEL